MISKKAENNISKCFELSLRQNLLGFGRKNVIDPNQPKQKNHNIHYVVKNIMLLNKYGVDYNFGIQNNKLHDANGVYYKND